MSLNDFFTKYPNAKFVRFFYDIVYDFYKTTHCCIYVKYEQGNNELSLQIFNCFMTCKETLALNRKCVVRGYDSTIFDKTNLFKQLDNTDGVSVIIDKQNENYFIDYIVR